MIGLRFQKIGGISILLRQNLAALFFDIATQASGGFGSENASFFWHEKGGREGTESGREIPCIMPFPELQYPKPEHEKEPFWTGGGSGCRTWSRRAL